MNTKNRSGNAILIILVLFVVIGGLLFFLYREQKNATPLPPSVPPTSELPEVPVVPAVPEKIPPTISEQELADSPQNATYVIEGKQVTLQNGTAETSVPNSSTVITTTLFGQPAYGDMTGDGVEDAAMYLVQSGQGSGVFYYVAAAIAESSGYLGTNAIFIGDRIAPQNISIVDALALANYAERNPGESMDVRPSVGVSKYFEIERETLVETTP